MAESDMSKSSWQKNRLRREAAFIRHEEKGQPSSRER
jgi:hypothetical protein